MHLSACTDSASIIRGPTLARWRLLLLTGARSLMHSSNQALLHSWVLGVSLNVKSREEDEVLQAAELSAKLIQRTTSEAPHRLCTSLAAVMSRTCGSPCQRTGERGPQSGHAGSCQEDGLLSARGGSQETGFRACREVQPNGSGLKTFPKEGEDKNIRIYRRAGCQVPP